MEDEGNEKAKKERISFKLNMLKLFNPVVKEIQDFNIIVELVMKFIAYSDLDELGNVMKGNNKLQKTILFELMKKSIEDSKFSYKAIDRLKLTLSYDEKVEVFSTVRTEIAKLSRETECIKNINNKLNEIVKSRRDNTVRALSDYLEKYPFQFLVELVRVLLEKINSCDNIIQSIKNDSKIVKEFYIYLVCEHLKTNKNLSSKNIFTLF